MLTDLTSAKSYLKITNTDYDTLLAGLVTVADSMLSDYLNQDLNAGSKTEIVNGNNDYLLFLRSYPVNTITSVSHWDGDSWEEIDSAAYSLLTNDHVAYIRRTDAIFTPGSMNYKIVYTRGYSSIPTPVKQVATELTAVMFKESSIKATADGRLGVSGTTTNFGGIAESVQYKSEWSKWKDILNKYRIPTV